MRGTRRSLPVVLLVAGMLAGLACLGVAQVAAHHGWSGYDSNQVLTLVGVIREAG